MILIQLIRLLIKEIHLLNRLRLYKELFLESARFSYLRGYNNDLTEKTTILLFPGEHLIDNRPGYAIYDNDPLGAYAVPQLVVLEFLHHKLYH